MAYNALSEKAYRRGFPLDPRTKMAILIAISTFVMASAGGERLIYFYIFFALLPFLLFLTVGQYVRSIVYLVLLPAIFSLQIFVLPMLQPGVIQYLLLAICGIMLRFVPTIAMALYITSTMTVSEFVAAMGRMHIPEKIIIPFSVIFRFIPTFIEEIRAIWDAMGMRGIRLGGGQSSKILEYLLVPSIMCTVRIADELSAAALARGLGGPVRRTNMCHLRLRLIDWLFLAVVAAAFTWWGIGVVGL